MGVEICSRKAFCWDRGSNQSCRHRDPPGYRLMAMAASPGDAAVRYQIFTASCFANRTPHLIYFVRSPGACAGLAQLVEQLFRKQQVCGSSPQVGSVRDAGRLADVAEQADALRSGRSGGNPVGVRISPSAPGRESFRDELARARLHAKTLTAES